MCDDDDERRAKKPFLFCVPSFFSRVGGCWLLEWRRRKLEWEEGKSYKLRKRGREGEVGTDVLPNSPPTFFSPPFFDESPPGEKGRNSESDAFPFYLLQCILEENKASRITGEGGAGKPLLLRTAYSVHRTLQESEKKLVDVE